MPQLGHGLGGSLGFRHERAQVAPFLYWLMEAWSCVGQWLKDSVRPDLVGPSLVLPVLPSYCKS